MRVARVFYTTFTFAAAALLLSPLIGATTIPIAVLFGDSSNPELTHIFWQLRISRTLLAFFTGAGLSIAGLVFQSIFRNPLATPYTLGVSGGAALGAAIATLFGFFHLGALGVIGAAFIGALLTIIVLRIIGIGLPGSSPVLLLAGVMLSFFSSSLIAFVQYLSDFTQLLRITRWLMGSLEVSGYHEVLFVVPVVVLVAASVFVFRHELNLLMLDDELALSRGVDVEKVQWMLLILTSLGIGVLVSVVGPIGFVGMVVPHVFRYLVGTNHRYLIPLAVIGGGAFLVLCDTVARVLIAPFELPVGIITALIGSPWFLVLLLRQRSMSR